MFGFLSGRKKGKIEKQFAWMTLKAIGQDMDDGPMDIKKVTTFIVRISIFGGLDIKKSLDSQKVLKDADPDKVVIEGAAFTFAHVIQACLTASKIDIYSYEKLVAGVMSCSEILRQVLEKTSEIPVPVGFKTPYANKSLRDSADTLVVRILEAGHVPNLEGIKDHVMVMGAVGGFAKAFLPAIVETTMNVLRHYADNNDS